MYKHRALLGAYNDRSKMPREYLVWNRLKHRLRQGAFGGATMCKSWLDSFENFYKDMGKKPANKHLARKNPLKPFCGDNCYWSVRRGTNRKYYEYQGTAYTVEQICDELNISSATLRINIKKGLTLAEIFEKYTPKTVYELKNLPKDRDTAIKFAYKNGVAPKEIAEYFKLTRERIRQIINK